MSGVDRKLAPAEQLVALAAQEAELDAERFGLDDAWAVGAWLRETAIDRGHAVAISVLLGGQRAFHAATPGSAPLNDAWLERKLRVVAHFGRSSLAVHYDFRSRGADFDTTSRLDPRTHAAAGGAVPLRVRGTLVGGVAVSGLEQHDDHDLVVEALRAHAAAGS